MSLNPMAPAFAFGGKIVDLISEVVEDKDLALKLTREVQREANQFSLAVLNTTTTPRVDAFVKIMYALRDVIIPLLRPIGAAALTALGAYMAVEQIPVPEWLNAVMVAMFPGWMASRHAHKRAEISVQTEQARLEQITQAVRRTAPAGYLDQEAG